MSMSGTTASQPSAPATTGRRVGVTGLLLPGALGVVAVSIIGALVSVAGGLSPDLATALGPTARLSVPIPMMAALVALSILASLRRRRLAATSAALLAAACAACIVSGFFDGGYADHSLTGGQRTIQLLLVVTLASLGALALVRLRRVLRG